MANIKRYKVKHDWNDSMEVTLEVDFDTLTPEVAREINEFWGDDDCRLSQANGNVQLAVVRLFGLRMMYLMLETGGANFNETAKGLDGANTAAYWSEKLRNEEGWGAEKEGTRFGWCGIRLVAAEVAGPDFDDLLVQEI